MNGEERTRGVGCWRRRVRGGFLLQVPSRSGEEEKEEEGKEEHCPIRLTCAPRPSRRNLRTHCLATSSIFPHFPAWHLWARCAPATVALVAAARLSHRPLVGLRPSESASAPHPTAVSHRCEGCWSASLRSLKSSRRRQGGCCASRWSRRLRGAEADAPPPPSAALHTNGQTLTHQPTRQVGVQIHPTLHDEVHDKRKNITVQLTCCASSSHIPLHCSSPPPHHRQ